MVDTISIGQKGEQVALDYLASQDHKIIAKNYRYKKVGEIDLVTRFKNTIHFIEVKTRKNSNYGYPHEAVIYSKLKKIIRTAEIFRDQNNLQNINYQFDIVSITLDDNKIEYYENITL